MSQVVRLARDLRTALDHRFGTYDLTSQQAGALVHVYTGVQSPRRLADVLGTDTAGITRLLDRLESKSLVVRRRDPTDRRALVVDLTEDGRALIPHLPPIFDRVAVALTRDTSDADLAITLRVLDRMLDQLEGGHARPSGGLDVRYRSDDR